MDFDSLDKLLHKNQNNIEQRKLARANLKKVAFDTTRFTQDLVVNPRPGVQEFVRRDPFISMDVADKIKIILKLHDLCQELKNKFERSPEWKNSYVRALYDATSDILQLGKNKSNYMLNRIDHLDQVFYLRYRLYLSDTVRYSPSELKDIILSKDEKLMQIDPIHRQPQTDVVSALDSSSLGNIIQKSNDPNVERVITITIKDDNKNEKPIVAEEKEKSIKVDAKQTEDILMLKAFIEQQKEELEKIKTEFSDNKKEMDKKLSATKDELNKQKYIPHIKDELTKELLSANKENYSKHDMLYINALAELEALESLEKFKK